MQGISKSLTWIRVFTAVYVLYNINTHRLADVYRHDGRQTVHSEQHLMLSPRLFNKHIYRPSTVHKDHDYTMASTSAQGESLCL